jgi:WbqC-like protein family
LIVAVHQPNYFPWLGYFDKIMRADVFVLLDHVQMSRGHGRNRSYTQRVQILGHGRPTWLTVPVSKGHGSDQAISETFPDSQADWRRMHLVMLERCYEKHPAFDEVFLQVRAALTSASGSLADINAHIIGVLAGEIGAPCRFVRSSALPPMGTRKTELLVEVVRAVGGTRYLYGKGGAQYQDNEAFRHAGIEPIAQEYVQPTYPQVGSDVFIPGLSILDCLFNIGLRKAVSYLSVVRNDR